MRKSNLGNRMKEYENVSKTKLIKRMPVIIRLDGQAFHTFTKGFNKPFDKILIKTMQETTKYLCENIQNCVFGYTQSDEITLVLVDYHDINVSTYFDNEVQKLCSITASMATMFFNKIFTILVTEYILLHPNSKLNNIYTRKLNKAIFDSRCFNIPVDEVTNLIYWRQLDAITNSILSVGQANFSSQELQYKSCNEIKQMLKQKNINWDRLPVHYQRGTAFKKVELSCNKYGWIIDKEMPVLYGDKREYLENIIAMKG